jgi:hypothetical protein
MVSTNVQSRTGSQKGSFQYKQWCSINKKFVYLPVKSMPVAKDTLRSDCVNVVIQVCLYAVSFFVVQGKAGSN